MGVLVDMRVDRTQDRAQMRETIARAREAERRGNLPIGARIVLDGRVVAEGMNSIWQPTLDRTRHAEMEALRAVPQGLWPRARAMTLYTTLEPCLMCAGAILLHEIGRLVYGATDPYGGIGAARDHLPPYFREQWARMEWVGPVLPEECDPLYARALELERIGRAGTGPGGAAFRD